MTISSGRRGVAAAAIFTLLLSLMPAGFVSAATVGPSTPATGTNVSSSGGDHAWSNASNARVSNDSYATSDLSNSGNPSTYLQTTGYGFSIPAGSTINGITATIERKQSCVDFNPPCSSAVTDNVVKLLKAGVQVGSNKATSTVWGTSDSTISYGGSSDLWGTTWTVTDINNGNFGISLQAKRSSGGDRRASVDAMAITVYYTPGDTTPPPAPTIDSAPPAIASSTAFSFSFSDTEPGVTFVCRVDSDPFSSCTSPLSGTTIAGSHQFDVKARDAANNEATTSYAWIIDTTAPSVVVSSGASNPTNASPVPVAITFSEDVSDFDISDIMVSNGSAADFSSSDAHTYSVNITPSGDPITISIAVPSDAAHDAAGNGSTDSNTLTRTYDTVAPSVTITGGPTEGSYTNQTSPTFTFEMTNGTSVSCSEDGGAYAACSGDPSSHTFVAALSSGTHSFSVKASDGVNPDSIATVNFIVDTTRPVPTISSSVVSPTSAASVPVAVDFDSAVSNFDESDLAVSNASVSDFAGSGTSYSFTLNPAGNGLVTVNVPAGVADEANGSGNTNDAAASPLSFTYEAPPAECNGSSFDTFTLGSVNGQGGWSITGPYDQAVVSNNYGFSSFGCQTLRISDAVTSGSFGDQLFSPSNDNEAGETAAATSSYSGGARKSHFEAQFDLASAVPGAMQSGMHLSVSPDRGDGARMSYLRFEDQSDGIHVFFDDALNTGPLGSTTTWRETEIAGGSATTSALTRTPHTIKFSMDFVDGSANDVVQIYIDGTLVHTGTSWEDYYRYDLEQGGSNNQVPTVDSLLFRESGDAQESDSGKGFLVDNFSELSSTPASAPATTTTDSGGSSHHGGTTIVTPAGTTGGEVLGASTGPADGCSALLKTYMRLGGDNDQVEVMLLQNFLNGELGTTLAVSGIFDQPTDAAVRAFQTKYADEVLAPWGLTQPTGFVYTLTQWKINDLSCPGSAPKPHVASFIPGGIGGEGDGSSAVGTRNDGVAAGVVLGDDTSASSTASSTTAKNPAAAALGFGASLPSWFWLLVLALILLGYWSWRAYQKYGTQA